MGEKYSQLIINTALSNPTGKTAMPGIFFSSAYEIDNLQIIQDLRLGDWTHPTTGEDLNKYAARMYPNGTKYIDFLNDPSSITDDIPQNISTRINAAFTSNYDGNDVIDPAIYNFIGAFAAVLVGVGVVTFSSTMHHYFDQDHN